MLKKLKIEGTIKIETGLHIGGSTEFAAIGAIDSPLSNKEELAQLGAKSYTETKFENTIDRFTAVATPRQIERVIRGSKFDFELIYDVEKESEVEEDIQLVKTGLELLENDYLGGSGSRGYGKVKFENLSIKPVLGDYDVKGLDAILEG